MRIFERAFLSELTGALTAMTVMAALAVTAAPAAAATLKIATVSPEGSAWMRLLREGAREVNARTDGRVDFRFYPGGVMGDDRAVLRKIRLRQLDGAVLTAGGLVQNYADIQLYGLPLLFESYEEADYVRERLDPRLMAGLEERGFVTFGFAEVGFAYAMSKRPVRSISDVRSQRVWTPDGDPGSARALQAFGINPVPLSIADVLAGLQTGLINGVAVPPVGAIALQWHTQLDYVMDMPLLYVYGLLAVAQRPFNRLSEADRAIVREVMAGVVDNVNARSRRDHESAFQALLAQSVERIAPDPEQMPEWHEYAERANAELVRAGLLSADLLDAVYALRREFRNGLD
jgi:TRAP-type transport system periplasmic protein